MIRRIFIILILFFSFVSCQENNEVEKLGIEFIERQNIRLSLEIYSIYQEKGKREDDKQVYDNVRAIRQIRDTLDQYYNNGEFDSQFTQKLDSYKKGLDSISHVLNYNNSGHLNIIESNRQHFEGNSFTYLMSLTLYEYDLLYFNANLMGGIGVQFLSSVQFSKSSYQKGEQVIFTNTAFDIDYYENFKYNSVTFYCNGEMQKMDYSLEQIVNTAVVKFQPLKTGIYNIEINTSFDTHFKKSILDKVSAYIEIK